MDAGLLALVQSRAEPEQTFVERSIWQGTSSERAEAQVEQARIGAAPLTCGSAPAAGRCAGGRLPSDSVFERQSPRQEEQGRGEDACSLASSLVAGWSREPRQQWSLEASVGRPPRRRLPSHLFRCTPCRNLARTTACERLTLFCAERQLDLAYRPTDGSRSVRYSTCGPLALRPAELLVHRQPWRPHEIVDTASLLPSRLDPIAPSPAEAPRADLPLYAVARHQSRMARHGSVLRLA